MAAKYSEITDKQNALWLDGEIRMLSYSSFGTYKLNDEDENLLKELFHTIEELEPVQKESICDDRKYKFWFSVPAPTVEEYYDAYHEEYTTRKEMEEEWKYYYPYPSCWYQVTAITHEDRKNERFYGIFLNSDYILSAGDSNAVADNGISASPVILFLTEKVKDVIRMVQKGTYNQMIEKELPLRYRKGTISRKDYYALFPDLKKELLDGLTESEIREFAEYAEKEDIPDSSLIPEMTARTFFEACDCGYKSCRYKERKSMLFHDTEEEHQRYGKITPRERYSMYADGRDDGLSSLPLDDAKAFEAWNQKKEPYYKFNGRHPFEVRTSFSISHSIHLYAMQKKDTPDMTKQEDKDRWIFTSHGWYFLVSCTEPAETAEVVRWTLALGRAHYPVLVYNGKDIAERLTETGRIGIMPYGSDIFSRRNYGMFHGDISDTAALEEVDYENPDVTGKIDWIPEEKVELKKEGSIEKDVSELV